MRTKTLLFLFLLTCGVLNAQDTIRTLVITECRLDDARHSYIELTNMGTTTLDLSKFEVGVIGAWEGMLEPAKMDVGRWDGHPAQNYYFMLPAKQLDPGKSFVIAGAYDYAFEQFHKAPDLYTRLMNKKEFWKLADVMLHFPESNTGDVTDSVTPYYHILDNWNGRECLYVRYHFTNSLGNKDSLVTDQVNGIFTGTNYTRPQAGAVNVAGMTNATNLATLVRKFSVDKGNLAFVQGTDVSESEWLPIPLQQDHWEMSRKLFWTAGSQTNTVLNATTFASTTATIDFTEGASTITVPWGTRRDDSIMNLITKTPGLAWHYAYNKVRADSAFLSAQTGDTLTVYACGTTLDSKEFRVIVLAPATNACIAMPKRVPNSRGWFGGPTDNGFCKISVGANPDTISNAGWYGFGIGFGTRADSLLKYIEVADGATAAIVWKNNDDRVDLVDGDKLKVTAADGTTTKEYYIKVNHYMPSHNGYLSAITWPDIPSSYKGTLDWKGDTIPDFASNVYTYTVSVPADAEGIPALVGTPQNINSTVDVQRATNLWGSVAGKTTTFKVTADDDTTIHSYAVVLNKEKAESEIQQWAGAPFISQIAWRDQWANTFVEIVNPGTGTLDLSDYLLTSGYVNTAAAAIQQYSAADTSSYKNRFMKYIPGYKWQDSLSWMQEPAIAIPDGITNSIIAPGDVFVVGDILNRSLIPWFASQACDVILSPKLNPWHEYYGNATLAGWMGTNYYLFHIDNDSIKQGLKPVTDPNDFTLIDQFGDGTSNTKVVGGVTRDQIQGFIRKPEIFTGNPEPAGSFGTDAATSEWLFTNRAYWDALGLTWMDDILAICRGLGSHFMNEVTVYKSTISSLVYKVSHGYSMKESINGVVSGTTTDQFLANILKTDAGQTLTVISASTGDILTGSDVVADADSLIVLSADKVNTSKYILDVTADGLSSNAVLTSATYTVTTTGSTGTITNMEYGAKLKDVFDSCDAPATASSYMAINSDGAYVPFKMLNFDTAYVDVLVSSDVYFEVIAEDGVTKITYQLKPSPSGDTCAFVTSSLYTVSKTAITYIPQGTTPASFKRNLIPCEGATLKVLDKNDNERLFGTIALDDKLVVTSADGDHVKTYDLNFLIKGIIYIPAIVLSDIYDVDPVFYNIVGLTDKLTVSEFMANILYDDGVTIKVYGANGVEKTGVTKMKEGDYIVATSKDEENTYSTEVLVSINEHTGSALRVAPNPSKGDFRVYGLQAGNRIEVVNMLGIRVSETVATAETETIKLGNQRSGIYFITVSNGKDVVARIKVVKE